MSSLSEETKGKFIFLSLLSGHNAGIKWLFMHEEEGFHHN